MFWRMKWIFIRHLLCLDSAGHFRYIRMLNSPAHRCYSFSLMDRKLKLRGLGHLVHGLPDSLCQTPVDLTALPVLILLTGFVSCKGCRHSPKSLNLFLTFITSCSELHSFSPSASFSVSLSLIFGVRVGSSKHHWMGSGGSTGHEVPADWKDFKTFRCR